jgi:hypothetical protein
VIFGLFWCTFALHALFSHHRGTQSVNGLYKWSSASSLILQPVSVALQRAGAPNSMELLVAKSEQTAFASGNVVTMTQASNAWLIGLPPNDLFYAAPKSNDVPVSGWKVMDGKDPVPTVRTIGNMPNSLSSDATNGPRT